MSIDIPLLRKSCRDPVFCNSVSPELLSVIVNALLVGIENNNDSPLVATKQEKDDLMATISNILLINRHLHTSYFTPNFSVSTLVYLNDYLASPESKNDRNDPGHYQRLVAVYRLIFLILFDTCDEDASTKDLVLRTCNTLKTGLEECIGDIDKFQKDNFFNMVMVEILKGLSTIYHNYSPIFGKIRVDEYIFLLDRIDLTKHTVMTKYIVNVLVMVFTINVNNGSYSCVDAYTTEDAAIFFNCLLTLLRFKLSHYKLLDDIEIDDLTNIYVLVNHLCTSLSRSQREFSALKNLLIDKILPRNSGSTSAIYLDSLKLISTTGFSDDDQTGALISDDNKISQFKNIFLQCMYNLCILKDSDQTVIVVTFLELVGYVLAKNFIELNSIQIPSHINLDDYLKPKNEKSESLEFESNKLNGAWNSILQMSEKTKGESQTEMSEEEKEREAEKLFVLFDRMEKTGVFQGFKNPVREWQQSGKFEDL